jgi:ribosome-binding ATPase YchF (GTP1/OBG family)
MEIGIVGKPNVGKSTLFKAMTMADVEIANFPFTTIKPNVGVGFARRPCVCKDFGLSCNPRNSSCIEGVRFIPVKLIDVAGLVPGAHEGKGLGNQFLDDLRQADALIHVVDIAGRTDDLGNPAEGHDPENDIRFLEEEIDSWFAGILTRNWAKIYQQVKHLGKKMVAELTTQLSGLEVTEADVKSALRDTGLEENVDWTDSDIRRFAAALRKAGKPIMLCGNKIDLDKGNFERLSAKYQIKPACAEAELGLRNAAAAGLVHYLPGDSNFQVLKEMNEKQQKALDFIDKNVMKRFGSTGVQSCLNAVVFDVLKQIVVYPVENENKLSDSKGNVLPDVHLLAEGSTAEDLAYRVHTDLGDRFIGAIDCRTKKKIGRDHVLKDGDVIKIIVRK